MYTPPTSMSTDRSPTPDETAAHTVKKFEHRSVYIHTFIQYPETERRERQRLSVPVPRLRLVPPDPFVRHVDIGPNGTNEVPRRIPSLYLSNTPWRLRQKLEHHQRNQDQPPTSRITISRDGQGSWTSSHHHHHCCRANRMPIAIDLRRGANALAVWTIISISGVSLFFPLSFSRWVGVLLSFGLFSSPSFFETTILAREIASPRTVFVGCLTGVLLLLLLLLQMKGCEERFFFHFLLLLPPLSSFI